MKTRPTFKPTIEEPGPGDRDLRSLEWLAWLMDRSIAIPGTPIRVGLDAILGLLPVGGDFLTGLIQAGIVLVAISRYKVPRSVAARMAANVLLDTVLGSLPIVGDVFDAAFKANTRNLALLKQEREKREREQRVATRSSLAFLALIAGAFFVVLALVLIGFVTVVAWLLKRPLL